MTTSVQVTSAMEWPLRGWSCWAWNTVLASEFSLVFERSVGLQCLPSLGPDGLGDKPLLDFLIPMRDQSCSLQ